MRGVCVALVLLGLVSVSPSLAYSQSQRGCAYYDPDQGLVYGLCDLDKTYCSYGCRKHVCWKQCLNKEGECAVKHRGYALATSNLSVSPVSCDVHQDCLDKIDFDKQGSKCFFKDPNY